MTTLTSLDPLADDLQRVEQAAEDEDGGAVVLVGEDRNVGRLFQVIGDGEGARRGDVVEADRAEGRRDREADVWMMSSGSLVSRQIGKASMPAKVLKMTLLPSAIGSAASAGPVSRPKMSEPSVRMATVLPRQVRSNEASGVAG